MLRGLLVVIAVVFFAHGSVTSAQSDPGRDAEARGLFEAGRAAFDQGRYQDALGYFDRAYQLSRRPQLLYNIGQVHDRLRHDEEALTALQQYLKQVPGATNRSEVEHRIEALRQAMVGTLHFTLSPAAAQLWIDGEAKTLDASGRLQVGIGSHEILVRAEGYNELRQRMNVRGGDMVELPITLQPADGQPALTPTTIVTTPGTTQPNTEPQILPAQPNPPGQPQVVEAPSPTTPPATPQPQSTPTWQDSGGSSTATTLGWVSLASSLVFLGGGTVFALLGNSEFDSLNDECRATCTRAEIEDKGGTVKTFELLTNVGFIGGGVLAGLSAVLFIVGGSSGSEQASAPPALVIGPTSITAQGSF